MREGYPTEDSDRRYIITLQVHADTIVLIGSPRAGLYIITVSDKYGNPMTSATSAPCSRRGAVYPRRHRDIQWVVCALVPINPTERNSCQVLMQSCSHASGIDGVHVYHVAVTVLFPFDYLPLVVKAEFLPCPSVEFLTTPRPLQPEKIMTDSLFQS